MPPLAPITATPIPIAAPADQVERAAIEVLGARRLDGSLVIGPEPGSAEPDVTVTIDVRPAGTDRATVAVSAEVEAEIPFFSWFIRPLLRIGRRRRCAHTIAVLRHALEGAPEPAPLAPVFGLPPVRFTHAQATMLAAASAAAAVVAFSTALFGQLADPISTAFHASDAKIGVAFAVTRVGVLFALFATALADRRGRRPLILLGVVGTTVACAISAAAPSLLVFTGAQILQRGAVITTATVAAIAVIEEAPDGARAYALSMLALAGGLGFSLSIVLLPLGDVGTWGWRIPFVLGALTILVVPAIGRRLEETTRYEAVAARTDVARGRVREIVDRTYQRRFILLAFVAFLTSMFSAPSSSLMNKYLTDDRGFTNTGIAIFRTVTTAVPGLIGLVLGGRLAEARGRRPVAAVALFVATATQMIFFLIGGPVLWFMSAVSILAAGASGIALGSLDAELFPTEVRSTSNALLVVIGVMGSVCGLLVAGLLSDPLGGLGRAIALTGIGALVAAIFVIPRLPESAARTLDDISPTEEYGPDP